jgi:hypothetical protein
MKYFGYQSYASDDVYDFIEEFVDSDGKLTERNRLRGRKILIETWNMMFEGEPYTLCDCHEFIGIFMFFFLSGTKVTKTMGENMVNALKDLLDCDNFKYWDEPDRRKKRLEGELYLLEKFMNNDEKYLKNRGTPTWKKNNDNVVAEI